MNYEVIIGIEIHLELKTQTKMFSAAAVSANAPANTCVSPTDIAIPGTLPLLNEEAVRLAVMTAYALNCEIDDLLRFDRKNYYYADLPKGYQITQQDYPLGKNGFVTIKDQGKVQNIRINRLHLEEDTAKLFHYETTTAIDFNRCGVPLIEIVSEPDMRSGEQAMAYVEKLRSILYYLGVSDCKMENGSLRCDINISLRPEGTMAFGNKVEVKNLNSIANIGKAVNAEVNRQTALLDSGTTVEQSTYRYDENSRQTILMRKKEGAVDYRYFPENNIPLIRLSKEFIEAAKAAIGELPDQRYQRYQNLGLNDYDSQQLVNNKALSDYFDEVCRYSDNYKSCCNWLLGDFSAYLAKELVEANATAIKPEALGELVALIDKQTISSKQAKEVFQEMLGGKMPQAIIAEKGLKQESDETKIIALLETVLNENPQSIQDYHQGKDRALGYLIGQVMKLSQGQANPAMVSALLKSALAQRKD